LGGISRRAFLATPMAARIDTVRLLRQRKDYIANGTRRCSPFSSDQWALLRHFRRLNRWSLSGVGGRAARSAASRRQKQWSGTDRLSRLLENKQECHIHDVTHRCLRPFSCKYLEWQGARGVKTPSVLPIPVRPRKIREGRSFQRRGWNRWSSSFPASFV